MMHVPSNGRNEEHKNQDALAWRRIVYI
jgi:hypothetical protein